MDKGVRKVLAGLLGLLVLGVTAAGLVWHYQHYVIVDGQIYSRSLEQLDLRGRQAQPEVVKRLRQALPDCQVIWDVPFQGQRYSEDTTALVAQDFTEANLTELSYFPQLEELTVENPTDYSLLAALQRQQPELKLHYTLQLGQVTAANTDRELTLLDLPREEVEKLDYLPELTQVAAGAGISLETLSTLQSYCHSRGLAFGIQVAGEFIPQDAAQVRLTGAGEEELYLLAALPQLEQLELISPQASGQALVDLRQNNPHVDVTWQVELLGNTYDSQTREVDLSATVVEDLAQVEQALQALPELETVIFGLCGQDDPDWGNSKTKNLAVCDIANEDMAAYRDRVKEQYKVVWTVRLGPVIALRTDADNFMPNHFGSGRLFDEYAYNLRYCTDMVCLDVGHMTLTDISFVEYMPKLKYLILAWTEVKYIEPIRSCKNLIFLELDNSTIRDYSPLVDCTALQDLNIGKTFCDITPILEMTWLKNLYMIFGDKGDAYRASQALPDTRVVATGNATVGGGWRRLPNYYDMRDALGVPYMN